MRFNHFINEVKPPDPREWAILCDDLLKNCQPFIKALRGVQNFGLWRGAKKLIDTSRLISVRTDRQPMDTSRETQNMLDKIFFKKFGWKARSEGLFGTGNKSFASMYGRPHLVFPVGQFKFIWSPEIKDLYTDMIERDMWIWERDPDGGFGILSKSIDEANYTDKDFHSAIGSGHEIMIKCKEYYLINQEFQFNGYKELF